MTTLDTNFAQTPCSILTAINESLSVIIEKSSNVTKTLGNEVLTRILHQSECLLSLKSRSSRGDSVFFITKIIEREEAILKEFLDSFYGEISKIQQDLKAKLTDACDKLDNARKTCRDLNADFEAELSEQEQVMIYEKKSSYIKTFQENRRDFLNSLVNQVHSQINDRMIGKVKEVDLLLTKKNLLNVEITKMEKKQIHFLKKQKKMRFEIFSIKHRELLTARCMNICSTGNGKFREFINIAEIFLTLLILTSLIP